MTAPTPDLPTRRDLRRRLSHPIFARVYDRLSAATEAAGNGQHRQRLLAGLAGPVVEIGAGNGLNFTHYPATVTEVVAFEPEPYLRARATEASRRAQVPVTVLDGTAEAISLPDGSMDAGAASLVLCSVADQPTALAELHRVIRPGGELRFYEHVLADDPHLARRQRRADHIWPLLMGGTHVDRATETAIAAAGFEIIDCEQFLFPHCWIARLSATHILGRAQRP
jgi:ubiquinone/menaquinone biosynthesis C-methylase UbiE